MILAMVVSVAIVTNIWPKRDKNVTNVKPDAMILAMLEFLLDCSSLDEFNLYITIPHPVLPAYSALKQKIALRCALTGKLHTAQRSQLNS